jgi:SAM-dependent methyltransferase
MAQQGTIMAGADTAIADAYEVLFRGLDQLGPGDEETTLAVLERVRPFLPAEPLVADMGCGVGASALVLARAMPDARVIAIDNHPPFVARFRERAASKRLTKRVTARVGDLGDPQRCGLHTGSLDLIWAESSIYAVDREQALRAWRELLRPGGCMVFSDVVWTVPTAARSPVAVDFWSREYPAMTDCGAVSRRLSEHGLRLIREIEMPRSAWSNYYDPLRARCAAIRAGVEPLSELGRVLATMEDEIALFDSDDRSYASVFFIARKIDSDADRPC